MPASPAPYFQWSGHCPTCDNDVDFVANSPWFRDQFLCTHCGSLPRERALIVAIESWFPQWRTAVIHESSPAQRGASARLSRECPQYIPSQYLQDQASGTTVDGIRSENLESLSFPNESLDLHITQDVLEHVFRPSQVFKEIARTLKPGGMHIGTVPLVNRSSPSALRAHLDHNEVVYVKPAQYHGSPDQDKKSLVTIDWGFDLCRHIFEACGLFTHLLKIDDLSHGIRAEFIEVFVTVKPRRSGSRLLKSSTFEPARLSGGLFPVGKGRFGIEAAADIPTMQAALAISPLFDAAWYLRSYPDVKATGMDPILHYLHHGSRELRNPSGDFSTGAYLRRYAGVRDSGINPLYHYLRYGKERGFEISRPE